MMKKTYYFYVLFMLFAGIISCSKDKQSVPAVETLAITVIKGTSAQSGGFVSSDGGTEIISRGVCWSTDSLSTINDSRTLDGKGTGTFISTIKGLMPSTRYYLRAYATNSAGTGYGKIITFSTGILSIGESFCGGIIAYILQPGDPGFDSNYVHGIIAAPADINTTAKWACAGDTVWGANGTAIGTGSQNTTDILNFCATPGIAARLCDSYMSDGYSDWYMPSKDELNKLYINRLIVGGFANAVYWSSSEYDAENAWSHSFDLGYQNISLKTASCCVRAVRSF